MGIGYIKATIFYQLVDTLKASIFKALLLSKYQLK